MKTIKKFISVIITMILLIIQVTAADVYTYKNIAISYTTCDIDGNGSVTPYDALLLLKYLNESIELSVEQLAVSDANSDSIITPYDVLCILQYAAEYIKPVEGNYKRSGIDVSKYQGEIDWTKVKNSGIDFAIIRAGYGKYTSQLDPYFEKYYNTCKSQKIPVGVYHFSYALTVEDAKEEANVMLEWIKGKSFEYPIYYDVESQKDLGVELTSQIIDTFCGILEDNGYYVGVYSYTYYLSNYISADTLSNYSVWVADLSDSGNTYKGEYDMWQYSHSGQVNGISGNVDLDYSYKNFPDIMVKYGLNGF